MFSTVRVLMFSSGAAYGRAEKEVTQLVVGHQLPFLPTPMGKGVLPDNHPLCVASARSRSVEGQRLIIMFESLIFIFDLK